LLQADKKTTKKKTFLGGPLASGGPRRCLTLPGGSASVSRYISESHKSTA